jgi:hypothetical protein
MFKNPEFEADFGKQSPESTRQAMAAAMRGFTPDNTVASKRAAREAAQAVDGKVAQIDYGPEQKNLLGVMSEAHKWADKLFPAPETVLDEVRRDKTIQDAAKRYIREPIANAPKWDKTPIPTLIQGRPVAVARQPVADIER